MRASLLTLIIAGCVGEANLGSAPRLVRPDAGHAELDGGAAVDVANDSPDAPVDSIDDTLTVELDAEPSTEPCSLCFDLLARSDTVLGDYTFAWEDGSSESRRHVCPSAPSSAYTVTLRELRSGRTASTTRSLAARADTCADAAVAKPTLCLRNGTFAVDPARPPSPANALPATPWLACAKMLPNQVLPNRPQIVESSATIMGMPVLPATEGTTYLGLAEFEQASAPLCAAIAPGDPRYFTLDLADVSGSLGPDVGLPRLEIWGGRAADCSQSEKLWESDSLSSGWTSHCVTIKPRYLTDNFTLRAVSSAPLTFPGRVLVDHIQSVAACP